MHRKYWSENLRRRHLLTDLGLDGKMDLMLNLVINKLYVKLWTEVPMASSCEHHNELSCFIKTRNFLISWATITLSRKALLLSLSESYILFRGVSPHNFSRPTLNGASIPTSNAQTSIKLMGTNWRHGVTKYEGQGVITSVSKIIRL
jgi:hypothetical protein